MSIDGDGEPGHSPEKEANRISLVVAVGFLVWLILALAGFGVGALIFYGVVRMFFRYAFDVELPNPLH